MSSFVGTLLGDKINLAKWKIQRQNGRNQLGGFTFPTETILTKQ